MYVLPELSVSVISYVVHEILKYNVLLDSSLTFTLLCCVITRWEQVVNLL